MYVQLKLLAIIIRSSSYVGMITVGRARQEEKAPGDMVTREVGRDRLVRASLARRESYKKRREKKVNNPHWSIDITT